jgi:hypothetical protein
MVENAMTWSDAMRGWLIGLIGIVVATGPAAAEMKIHLLDKTAPVVTGQVFEEEAWVLYEEEDTGYLFSVPRDRVQKLEIVQAGRVRTVQITSSEAKFRDSRRQVYIAILETGDKRAEDVFKRLQEEVRSLGTARSAATASQPAGPGQPTVTGISAQASLFALALQEEKVNRILEEAASIYRRNDRILQRAARYELSKSKPRYYFHR